MSAPANEERAAAIAVVDDRAKRLRAQAEDARRAAVEHDREADEAEATAAYFRGLS